MGRRPLSFLPTFLFLSINQAVGSICGVSVRDEILRGIKVALSRTKSPMNTTEEQGGRHHGLDILKHRNSYSFFGDPLPSFYLARATLTTRATAQERTENHVYRHTHLVAHRNGPLGNPRPDVSFWDRFLVFTAISFEKTRQPLVRFLRLTLRDS